MSIMHMDIESLRKALDEKNVQCTWIDGFAERDKCYVYL